MPARIQPPSNLKRRLGCFALTTVCLLLSVEAVSYAAGKFLQAKWCMYATPRPPQGRIVPSYAEYLRRRNPIYGWPFPDQFGSDLFNAYGARPSPACPDTTPETSDISLYGDSFTQSAGTDEEAWGNVLAGLSGCRVANYGQGGYGTDQAFLRYRSNGNDHASVVILSHVSEVIVRNLTRNRDLVMYEMWYAYKPRFILGPSGGLELVPMPALSEEEHLRFYGFASPPLDLDHESFHPGGPAGVTSLQFPYSWSVIRNFGDFRMRAKLAHRAPYAEFYRPGHPLHSLEITREIFKAFAEESRHRGQHPLVMLFPNREDVEAFRESKEWCYAPLRAELESAGVETLDLGSTIAERSAAGSLDEVYDRTGHFKPATDRIVAEFVYAKLQSLPEWGRFQHREGK